MGNENNIVEELGSVSENPVFSHAVYGEKFYFLKMDVPRSSGVSDEILVMVSERLIDVNENYLGCCIFVSGEFRSFNKHETATRSKLVLSLFAREINFTENTGEMQINHVSMEGYICKKPIYRRTPLGREIADILLAVNRPNRKSDYIPCICWGRNARFAGTFSIGTKIRLIGRIQSREYQKKLSDTDFETRTAYEVSVSRLEIVEENENEDNN